MNELKEIALRIFCAKASLLMLDNEANARYNKSLAQQSFSYARIFLKVAEEQDESISHSTDKPGV